jgi:hypothetical protein
LFVRAEPQSSHRPREDADRPVAAPAAFAIEVVTPDDISFGGCFDNKLQVWTGRWLQEPGQIQRLWVIETDDGLVLFESPLEPGATAADLAEVDAIMASMSLEAFTASAP